MILSDESTAKFEIEAMRKHIEALQKENNDWQERYYELDAGHSRLFKDFCKLQQENEQLRAKLDEWKYETKCHIDEVVAREKQMTQIKKTIQKLKETMNTKNKAHWFECDRCRTMRDVLTTIDMLEEKKNV